MVMIYTMSDFSLSHCIKLENSDSSISSGVKIGDTLYVSLSLFVYALEVKHDNTFGEPILAKYNVRKGVCKMFGDDKYVLFG